MKAPAFWYQPDGKLACRLAPLEKAYAWGAAVRKHFAQPYRAKVPVICVGNVTAGGAGKTPTALALAELLIADGNKPAFVSRGYGGTQHRPLLVDPQHHDAESVGDEALLLAKIAPTWIAYDRVAAIRKAEQWATHIILDDGLQNPNLLPDVSFLVMDGVVGIGNGHIIPVGPLREPFEDAQKKASAVLVVGPTLQGLTFSKPVLSAQLQPVVAVGFPRDKKFLAFAGIGRPQKFYDVCRAEGLHIVATQNFGDHHFFTSTELAKLMEKAKKFGAELLTTEKDHVRMPSVVQPRVLTFPVRLKFDDVDAVKKLLHSALAPTLPS
jgi:tetraacyldisaccharide 4'-kinase